tara:strand:+ start:454 stop:657 length:204 start_codon:yes stop_codon:yes gene_type:complete
MLEWGEPALEETATARLMLMLGGTTSSVTALTNSPPLQLIMAGVNLRYTVLGEVKPPGQRTVVPWIW